jgi:hypothetical protein
MKIDDNEKIKHLYNDWFKYTNNRENEIKQELLNEWTKKHGINSGDDILIEDYHNSRKLDKTVKYYRKGKLIGFYINVNLNQYEENCIYFIKPIIKAYKSDNKTLQKRHLFYRKFYKMDLNLLGKAILD